jgi:transposase
VAEIVRGPSGAAEDRRQGPRALTTVQRDRTRVINRSKGLRAAQGLGMPPGGDVSQQVEPLRLWAGPPLPAGRRHRLTQEWEHVPALTQRRAQWEAEGRAVLQTAEDAGTPKVQQLLRRKGLGRNRAGRCVMECCGGRAWRQRKEVGALRGLPSTPYARGPTAYEQGIAPAGNAPSRARAMEMAWGWLRL